MLSLLQFGTNPRLERLLSELKLQPVSPEDDLRGCRLFFAVAVDEGGPDPSFYAFLRRLRQELKLLEGCTGALVVDGSTELYTKAAAQELVTAASFAGCLFPGKPLVEATGSLYNQHIRAKNLGLGWQETYFYRVKELANWLETFEAPRFERPKILMLHASDKQRSNTLQLGRALCSRLTDCCDIRELQLLNGTVHDCRGCGYHACLHFSQNNTCFYGGAISDEVLPAIREADVLLFLCPNYNDALSANLMALINRMTNLVVQSDLGRTYLGAVVVSGYSGGDLVARQLMSAMCLNRGCILPPDFCLLQTANDPGDAMASEGMNDRLDAMAEKIRRQLLL